METPSQNGTYISSGADAAHQIGVRRFSTWRDLLITPAVTIGIWTIAILITWRVCASCSFFVQLALCYSLVVLFTLLVLKLIRTLWPFKAGVYSFQRAPFKTFLYNLYAFLEITNLSPLFLNGLVPPILRKPFYQLMGAKIGKGIVPIAGMLLDPPLVSMGENILIASQSILTCHFITSSGEIVIAPIEIGSGAVIGVNAIIMPGVRIGEHAMVAAMSMVPMFTTIAPGEVWAGVPACKVAERTVPGAYGSERNGTFAQAADRI